MDRIKQQYCLTHASGEDIYLFTLSNANGLTVTITNYGAIISSYKIPQADGSINDIVLGFDKVDDYLSAPYLAVYPYFGAIIGRYGNRIKNGEFMLDGEKYTLAKNNINDHLHGGITGFDKRVWQVESVGDTPHATLVLRYVSPHGEEGYPGELDIHLRFELNDNDELSYEFLAQADRPAILNLTHHGYFNLNNGAGTIEDHLVCIRASSILEQGDNFVTTGGFVQVENTVYDFRNPRAINTNWNEATGYDQSFVVKEQTGEQPVAEAWSARSGLQLQVFSTEPILHFYTGKWIDAIQGKQTVPYGSYSGFCFETQKHPNAINIPHFPSTILRPGETYRTKTIYKTGFR